MTTKNIDATYNDLLRLILSDGRVKKNRTGIDTIGIFGAQAKFKVNLNAFPILTTKKVWFKGIVHELLWFIKGDTNIKYLVDNDVHIWDEWRQPYGFDRQLVFVNKINCVYQPYSGNFSWEGYGISGDTNIKLAYIWEKMMRRCYDKNHHRYSLYGECGISVHSDWHNPKTFIEQVKQIPHWYYKQKKWNEFELDKDYYGSKQYGLGTSVWLHTNENNFYSKAVSPIEVVDKDGNKTVYLTANEAAREIGMSMSSFNRILNNGFPQIIKGNNRNFIGWEFKELNFENKVLRMELIPDGELGFVYGRAWRNFEGVDQLQKVLDKLKSNPDDRRMIVSAWHPYWIDHCALPPCHCLFHFNTEELTAEERHNYAYDTLDLGDCPDNVTLRTEEEEMAWMDKLNIPKRRLNLLLYQRSCDTFLGVPFNITSYSLLLAMVAHVTNMIPGTFTHTYGDLHIYTNHMEQVKLQLKREPKPLPALVLNPKIKNLFDFKYEDIKLDGYDSHPAIKAEVAI